MDIKNDDQLKKRFCYIEWESGETLWPEEFNKGSHLVFLLSGDTEIVYGNLHPRVVTGGNMLVLSPVTNCIGRTITPVKMLSVELDGLDYGCDKYGMQTLTSIYTLIKYEFQELEIRPPLDVFLELIIEYLQQETIAWRVYAVKIKELFIVLRAYYNSEELTMLFYPLLGKNMEFKKMVTDNYLKVKNATEYAELCGYSLGVFQRKFKDVFGETVYQWMQRQKAEQIKHRLMVTDINPKELAEEFDFASPAHLNKFCKIWFGMTPSELRQTYLLKKNLK